MSVIGVIKNGVVVLPAEANFPDGAEVKVETIQNMTPRGLADAVASLAKARPHLPADYALNHGHYVRGEPKK